MKPKPTAQRVRSHYARQKEKGLHHLKVWAHPEDVERIKAYVAKLNKKRGLTA